MSIRSIKNGYKALRVKAFHTAQRLGVDVLPRHWYSEIPDVRRLQTTESWRAPFTMIGVRGSVAEQGAWLKKLVDASPPASNVYARACQDEGSTGYGPIEAEALFAFVAVKRPPVIVQIGCGVSTSVILQAAASSNYTPRVVCVEPFPSYYLRERARAGQLELMPIPAQQLDCRLLESIPQGGLFFVDSTHTLGPAGECTRIILEMLPRVREGAFAHFHDIWFPYDYDSNVLRTLFFWHESPLLHAFLVGNDSWRVLASLSMLHHGRPETLHAMFPTYRPRTHVNGIAIDEGHYPTSIYLTRN